MDQGLPSLGDPLKGRLHRCGMPNIIVNANLDNNDTPIYELTIHIEVISYYI